MLPYANKVKLVLTKFSFQAENVVEEACYSPFKQVCEENTEDVSDDEKKCVTVYESSCLTRYEPKNSEADGSKKFVALTRCDKIPTTLCSNKKCQIVQVIDNN